MAAVNYKVIKNFFSKDELKVYQKYCYNQLDRMTNIKTDPQSFSPCWYKDPLMIALLDTKLPLVEKESNLKLFPTYSYWRYYVFGGTLLTHTDRPACEISITACIKKYDNWPLIIENSTFEIEEGDALLYAGCDQSHGRPGVYKGEGIAQAFFHYVNQKGPYADYAYDNIKMNKM
jgi:hypothetical protein|tara:strand:+ start:2992 stop:3516 length:525 start_codon:yes stop_codon:yes gene_type:complete